MRCLYGIFIMSDIKTLTIRNPEESHLCSGLYIVPTPIGNLRDMTLRALDVLNAADVIVCEDSRVTGKLLKAYNIQNKKKIIYNDHADDAMKNNIMGMVADKIVALVSDAGTPLISDPGYKLVRDCIGAGYFVTALPGANAILPAIQLSTLPSDHFTFVGFLPSKDKGVRDVLVRYLNVPETCVFYESPNRIEKTLNIINDVMGDRQIAVVREISKLYEQALHGSASEILTIMANKPLKGEIVIVINGAGEIDEDFDIDDLIRNSIAKGQSMKDLSTEIASVTGIKKKEIYNRALDIQKHL